MNSSFRYFGCSFTSGFQKESTGKSKISFSSLCRGLTE
ncbi:hypothetical protein CLOLEP_02356 [[Clostridium] leptum DSM 753]|uniref:Uncharacterized protein n=1 Tax=[Clostridium] leptum DSM 753 TaxID=428125 RepID=A7VUV9_9FIRM|nr:hypothetical protein CLOLEP_02356 [[Clostridium] leptum DSM 753]